MTVDWRRVINDLRYHGVSYEAQAEAAGVSSRRTITNWREGNGEPRYSQGERLLSIYRTVIGSTR